MKDFLGIDQETSAKKMDISQPTFHRLILSARKKIADAIVNGKAIKIHGGVYKMPGGDRTGPEGRGPRTGRAMGYCSGNDRPGYMEPGFRGRGFGRGFGAGRGFGRRVYIEEQPIEMAKEQKKKVLEAEAAEIEAELNAVKKELKDLK